MGHAGRIVSSERNQIVAIIGLQHAPIGIEEVAGVENIQADLDGIPLCPCPNIKIRGTIYLKIINFAVCTPGPI